jgi:hypothetical protein
MKIFVASTLLAAVSLTVGCGQPSSTKSEIKNAPNSNAVVQRVFLANKGKLVGTQEDGETPCSLEIRHGADGDLEARMTYLDLKIQKARDVTIPMKKFGYFGVFRNIDSGWFITYTINFNDYGIFESFDVDERFGGTRASCQLPAYGTGSRQPIP